MNEGTNPRPTSRRRMAANRGANSPFDGLQEASAAYRELVRQEGEAPPPAADQAAIALLTGDDSGPAVCDLTAIWRASLADETCPDAIGRRRYMSPRRFVNGWEHEVSAREDGPGGRILVDRPAALMYCVQLDSRVLDAAVEAIIQHGDRGIAADPIGAGVRAARGGPLGMMMVAYKAAKAAEMTMDEFAHAVLERAKREAARLDDFAAETLVSGVRQALEGAPRIVVQGEDRGD
jgi:hypothetical protein